MSLPQTMQALHLHTPGSPANLTLTTLPTPVPIPGQILLRVHAIGLNRSELLTRQHGRAPIGPVQLPRILGIEAVGTIAAAPGAEDNFPIGAKAATAVGGLGVFRDGCYAEYVLADAGNVRVIKETRVSWEVLGALPEMLQTAHGSLVRSLQWSAGKSLVVRGATTSVGFAALGLARMYNKRAGVEGVVVATTRRTDAETAQLLKDHGATHVVTETPLVSALKAILPAGADRVLDLVGATTLPDSLASLAAGGIACMTGIVGGGVNLDGFNVLAGIATERYLTAYGERTFQEGNFPLDELVAAVEAGELEVRVGRVFRGLEGVVEAHEVMERGEAVGKVVVVL